LSLGDAENDIAMLQTTDFGVIVANGAHPPLKHLDGEEQGRIIRTTREGPEGWNEAVLDFIQTPSRGTAGMTDFHQTTRWRRCTISPGGRPRRSSANWLPSRRTGPIALILPSLYSELQGEALPRIPRSSGEGALSCRDHHRPRPGERGGVQASQDLLLPAAAAAPHPLE
jgi:hypothetical protein